jgi:chemotaxis protein CheC
MELKPHAVDALKEIANVGMNRAAVQLSSLLDDDIEITIPEVSLVTHDEITGGLHIARQQDISCVLQPLQGQIDGAAMILFKMHEKDALMEALVGTGNIFSVVDMRSYEHEAMTEIGNIIITSSIAVMADMLGGEIVLGLPEYISTTIDSLAGHQMAAATKHEQPMLIMQADLLAVKRDVNGKILVIMGVTSMRDLLDRIDNYILGERKRNIS